MNNSRRTFVIQSLCGAGALSSLAIATNAQAQAQPALLETDPQAAALGYKIDGTKTDTIKYPNYAANQMCSGCALFQGKAGDASAACTLYGNKVVAGKAWCAAWTKKA